MPGRRYQVVTIGETMIRLTPENMERLEQADKLDFKIGGTESNTAIALARMGIRVAWISKLVNNPLGWKIANSVRAHGVDTSHIIWVDKGRVGVYFIEMGASPRPIQIFYDRANSAISTLRKEDLDLGILEQTEMLHFTGINLALSPNCREAMLELAGGARERGGKVSFDVNYRAKLWSPAEAGEAMGDLRGMVDLLFCTLNDAGTVFECKGEGDEVTRAMAERFSSPTTVITMGDEGALCLHDGEIVRGKAYPVERVDRVGAGDAFNAGFICGYLSSDIELGLKYGCIMAALKYTMPGDVAYISHEEVERLLSEVREGVDR